MVGVGGGVFGVGVCVLDCLVFVCVCWMRLKILGLFMSVRLCLLVNLIVLLVNCFDVIMKLFVVLWVVIMLYSFCMMLIFIFSVCYCLYCIKNFLVLFLFGWDSIRFMLLLGLLLFFLVMWWFCSLKFLFMSSLNLC